MTKKWGLTVSIPSNLVEVNWNEEGLKLVLFRWKVYYKDGRRNSFNPGYWGFATLTKFLYFKLGVITPRWRTVTTDRLFLINQVNLPCLNLFDSIHLVLIYFEPILFSFNPKLIKLVKSLFLTFFPSNWSIYSRGSCDLNIGHSDIGNIQNNRLFVVHYSGNGYDLIIQIKLQKST